MPGGGVFSVTRRLHAGQVVHLTWLSLLGCEVGQGHPGGPVHTGDTHAALSRFLNGGDAFVHLIRVFKHPEHE